jgi:hypothetical protein
MASMITLRNGLIPTLFLTTAILAGCSGSSSSNSNSAANSNAQHDSATSSDAAKTNAEELGMLVNLPYESEEVYWKNDESKKKITAVLKFKPEEVNRVVADAVRVREPESVALTPENWYPPELVAQSELSGDDTIKGKSYAATVFLQDPYNDGRIVRIDGTDDFVLEVSAKQ